MLLFAASLILVVLIMAVVFIVGEFATGELTEDTINSLLDKQQNISSQISSFLNVIVSLGSTIDTNRIMDSEYRSVTFDIIRSNAGNVRSICVAEYGLSGVNYYSEMDSRFIPESVNHFNESVNIAYGKNWIASYGNPYRDMMGVSTILPVYIIFYSSMNVHVVLDIEIDMTQLFFETCADYEYHDTDYSLSIYSNDWVLLETTANNPYITNDVLECAARLPIDYSDRMSLYRTSRFSRVSGGSIDLFTTNDHGFIIFGKLSDDYIENRVKPIMTMIIVVGFSALLSLFLIAIILWHFKRMQENDIRMKIETIQAKLDPHFLFNTLNSMVSLASEGENEKLISGFRNLSVFLRSSIELEKFVLLAEELKYIESYINIQKIRYDGRFIYECTVEDKSLLNENIPRFTLQPIIENCFTHGVSVIESGVVTIRLIVRCSCRLLVIEISNDAPCSDKDIHQAMSHHRKNYSCYSRTSLGIYMIDKELKLIYGKKYGIKVSHMSDGSGFTVQILLPLLRQRRIR